MELIDRDPFRAENIEQARRQTPEEKMLLGGDLFDMACEVMIAGIRHQNPGISDVDVLRIARQRLEFADRMEGRV